MSTRHHLPLPQTRCLLVLLALILPAACRTPSVRVSSRPAGARILVNGSDTGFFTPAQIALTDLERIGGEQPFKIEVIADGYRQVPAQYTKYELSVGRIVVSVLPPLLIVNLFRGFDYMSPDRVAFDLPVK